MKPLAPRMGDIESQPRRTVVDVDTMLFRHSPSALLPNKPKVGIDHVLCILHLGGTRTTFTDVRHAALPTIPVATAFTA